jgi:hypothetical protein
MCTPDMEILFEPTPSTTMNCTKSVSVSHEKPEIQKKDTESDDGEYIWESDYENNDSGEEADESAANESAANETEDESDNDKYVNNFTVTTENGESLQFVSFFSNNERMVKIELDGSITLPLDTLRSYVNNIDLELDRVIYTEDSEPILSNSLLFLIVISIYMALAIYIHLIIKNMPPVLE